LLPSPEPLGKKTRYTDEHLERIRAIKKLQAAHFPLAEIRTRLNTFTADELSTIADLVEPNQVQESAVDYIRNVLEPASRPVAMRAAIAMPAPVAARLALPSGPPPDTPTRPTESTPARRSQWERVSLDPDVELHVRRPLTRQANKRVERLIAIARELFKEEE
jgi:DNA-binding transcriptional MerR regulator